MKYTIHVAKTNLSKLIEKAQAGEEVIISRADKPVARLIPFSSEQPRRQPGTLKGKVSLNDSFFEPLPENELGPWEDG
jgi:prevent-host-death family protein